MLPASIRSTTRADRLVDAGVQAEGQAVAGGVDRIDQRVELGAPVAHHVQHRAEHLALDVGDFADFDERRGDEGAARGRLAEFDLRHSVAAVAHRLDMRVERVARLRGDHRADVGREPPRIADLELAPSRP